jgi:hypothetical protein
MLQAGVAVHHAGLIPVWKEFIEVLFNANKIKVLFATETLAAGVNMPARCTVVSSVTKRINSETVKLKTSQLLQMAGRAGRRGKDTQGTVVVMKNRFEDSRMGHKILTSEVDGIRSHFKTSYSLVVRLLQIKSEDECRALVERGFGSYQMARREEKKSIQADEDSNLEAYREVLQKYTLLGAREFLKLSRRLEKERRNEEFLLHKLAETDQDLVNAIADYMPLGTGLHLRNGEDGYFLGDVQIGGGTANRGYGVLTTGKRIYIVRKEHIQSFAEAEASIAPRTAEGLLALVDVASRWEEVPAAPTTEKKGGALDLLSVSKPEAAILQGVVRPEAVENSPILSAALRTLADAPPFPEVQKQLPGSVIKQQVIVRDLESQMDVQPISIDGQGELVLDALRYAAAQRDPVAFVTSGKKGADGGVTPRDAYAWRMFQSVQNILQTSGAMEGTEATALGQLVGSLTADNELWIAKVLKSPRVAALEPAAFAAIMCAIITDGYKASNAYIKYKPSEPAQEALNELEELSWELKAMQHTSMVEFPVFLAREPGGLVESWVRGVTWRELCKDTSLDQGDLCRMLRRTLEILKQIPLAYGVDQKVVDLASAAASRMNRFPVAEEDPETFAAVTGGDETTEAGTGFVMGVGLGGGVKNVDMSLESISILDDIFRDPASKTVV